MGIRRYAVTAAALTAGLSASADDFFEQHIRPVLVDRCYTCHSEAANELKGGLRLDSIAAMIQGGASGLPAVTPGDPDGSLLLKAIRHDDPDLRMPPKEPLPAPVVAAFEQWIRNGAPFPASNAPIDLFATAREHWAFQPPQPQTLPEVAGVDWPRTDVDRFLLAALESKDIEPAPEADRRTLIRRLSFDLLGLPPTPEETEAFAADPDPDAYEKLVDRYLASPHYGERWARHWLDVARYADTKGYVYGGREEANFTHSYVYRDWVVKALNDDMPYDEFVRLQLAADRLAEGPDLAAMGFLTLGQRFLGVVPDIIDDRIDTVTRGLMGLTVSCARCHDHKFDPVPTTDYYSLYGVFAASSERTVPLDPAAIEDERHAAFAAEMAKRQAALEETFAAKSAELESRLRSQVDRYLGAVPQANSLPTDDFYEIRNAEDLNPTIVRRWAAYIARQGADDPVFGPWNRAAAASADSFAAELHAALGADPQRGAVVTASQPAAPNVNPAVRAALTESAPADFAALAAQYGALFKSIDDEWLALVEAAGESTPPTALPDPNREALRQLLLADGSPIRVPGGAIVDLEWMFDEPARVELGRLNAEIDRWIVANDPAPAYAVVLADKPEMPVTRVFKRGNPAMHGDEVPRQFLELLSGPEREPFADGSGRGELAEAIASPDNPLSARVIVNRVWAWHFGRGLVATPSDFGVRSAPPSHPELLDWLALRFIEDGWSLKKLHRLIVTSSAYRQSSAADPNDARVAAAVLADPENALLWRFNRRRLSFEEMRDAMLAASGELDRTLGGKPVELTKAPYPVRRALYGRVDRQFLPGVFRVFDFPNPDMHSPERIGTTVPQQALYLMNNPFAQERSRAFAARAQSAAAEPRAQAEALFAWAYQRPATAAEIDRALAFVEAAEAITPPPPPVVEPSPWTYGYGAFDEAAGAMASFTPLPHFTGTAYQGGSSWPDGVLGWAQLTADGGHPGNTLDHAVVRRWTAPVAGTVTITGRIVHQRAEGDGIRCRIAASRHGLLGEWRVHNREADTNLYSIPVEAGDTIDFVVDILGVLNSDEHLWAPVVTLEGAESPKAWDAAAQFAAPYVEPVPPLAPWDKLAQVLLSSNEFLFVD